MNETRNEVRGQTISGSIDVDGNHYIECTFGETQLRYGGGTLPLFEQCDIQAPLSWYFHGPALRTIRLLQYQNQDGAAKQMLDDLFYSGRILDDEA